MIRRRTTTSTLPSVKVAATLRPSGSHAHALPIAALMRTPACRRAPSAQDCAAGTQDRPEP